MFFLALVGAPVLRRVDPPELRAALFHQLGAKARSWGWISIGVLLATGVVNLWYRGILTSALLSEMEFWETPMGRALAWKLVAVGIMVTTSAIHDFALGPLASKVNLPVERRHWHRRLAALLARFNAVVGIFLVYWAVRLARGG
jgi:hypothetical protein